MADIKLDVSKVTLNLETFAKQFAYEDMAKALYQEALLVAENSKALTPVDTGALRASHTVSEPITDSDGISVKIGAGGPTAPYSVYVHEDLEAHHEVGQAKFLQTAVSNAARTLPMRIAARLRRMTK